MIEIASDHLLGTELAMRGGTCIHKLHLTSPLRYSEDLDYVRGTHSGIGTYVDALRTIGLRAGLHEHQVERTADMVHVIFDADSTDGMRRIRIKIEMNVRETDPCFERSTIPYTVQSGWWSGEAVISTFELAELMGTKVRALYQRSKGRDLFDLWHVLTETNVVDARIVQALVHYMGDSVFTYKELASNLAAKLDDPDFRADLNDLVISPPAGYELAEAADIVMERLGSRLRGAPKLDEIREGRWRPKSA
jgi:predicted nucleotidyltransferase component of viral defense system